MGGDAVVRGLRRQPIAGTVHQAFRSGSWRAPGAQQERVAEHLLDRLLRSAGCRGQRLSCACIGAQT
jgi:hypothetical protein